MSTHAAFTEAWRDEWPQYGPSEFTVVNHDDGSFEMVRFDSVDGQWIKSGWRWTHVVRDGKGNDVYSEEIDLATALDITPSKQHAGILRAHQEGMRWIACVLAHTSTSNFAFDDLAKDQDVFQGLAILADRVKVMTEEIAEAVAARADDSN